MALGCLWWRAWAPFGAVVAAAVCVAGTWRHRPSLVRLFAWQAWHLATSTVTLRGRCGTWRHQRAFCVAGVALMALMALGSLSWVPFGRGRRGCLRGRRGNWRHRPSLCVAGVALGDMDRHFAWQVVALKY